MLRSRDNIFILIHLHYFGNDASFFTGSGTAGNIVSAGSGQYGAGVGSNGLPYTQTNRASTDTFAQRPGKTVSVQPGYHDL